MASRYDARPNSFLRQLPAVTSSAKYVPELDTRITAFYRYPRSRSGQRQRYALHSILELTDHKLEALHDYIQWLFPLPEPSPFNLDAPRIDAATAAAFRASAVLRANLVKAFKRMLRFFGFQLEYGPLRVVRAADFDKHAWNWCRGFSHNHLRITRIIRSLRILGCENEARAFYTALVQVSEEYPRFSTTSVMFWKRAVTRPLEVPPEDESYEDPPSDEESDDDDPEDEDFLDAEESDDDDPEDEDYLDAEDEDKSVGEKEPDLGEIDAELVALEEERRAYLEGLLGSETNSMEEHETENEADDEHPGKEKNMDEQRPKKKA